MAKKDVIQRYVKPDGTTVIRAFCLRNFLFFDEDDMVLDRELALANSELVLQVGQHYDVQKNRVNDQVIKQMRNKERPEFCPVQASLDIVDVALHLGQTKEDNPLCVFETEDETVQYLTGDMITKYYRWVTAKVFPQISKEDLKLISCHSIRVTAAVILHLAGKDPSYIKLRLRWLSDCFQGYLRNTKRTSAQHAAAVSEDKHGHFEGHGSLAFAHQATRTSSAQRRHFGRELGSRRRRLIPTLLQVSDNASK